MDTSLSINTWIKLESDVDALFDECFVKAQISQLTTHLTDNIKRVLVYPNEVCLLMPKDTVKMQILNLPLVSNQISNCLQFENLYDTPIDNQLTLLDKLATFIVNPNSRKELTINYAKTNYLTGEQLENRKIQSALEIVPVNRLDTADFHNILMVNSKRFRESSTDGQAIENTDEFKRYSAVINAVCNPESVKLFKSNYLNERDL